MIQRVQSIFLAIALIMCLLLFYFPVYRFINDASGNPELTATDYRILGKNALLTILNAIVATLTFISIFLFKNRNIQVRIVNLALLLTAVLTGLLFFVADTLSGGMNQRVEFIAGSYLPIITMICLFIAVRFIKRDEELVRSADRLR
jgi:membrane protease YdiL (CAAX protease family)